MLHSDALAGSKQCLHYKPCHFLDAQPSIGHIRVLQWQLQAKFPKVLLSVKWPDTSTCRLSHVAMHGWACQNLSFTTCQLARRMVDALGEAQPYFRGFVERTFAH
jgi:hypothetical protein